MSNHRTMAAALAAALLSLAVGPGSASGSFNDANLSGTYLIEAHGFENDNGAPTDTGENDILGLVTFDGSGGVVAGGGFSFSHADSFTSNERIYCSLTITGGGYSVDFFNGAGIISLSLGTGAFAGGAAACTTVSASAHLDFAFVLPDSTGTSASLQLTGFGPVPLAITGPPIPSFQVINFMVMTGTLHRR